MPLVPLYAWPRIRRYLTSGMVVGALWWPATQVAGQGSSGVVAPENPIATLGREIEILRAGGNTSQLATLLAKRAAAYQAQGYRQLALSDLQAAAGLVRRTSDGVLKASVVGALGQALVLGGRFSEGEAQLEEALREARATGSIRLTAAVRNDQGILMATVGREPEAVSAFAESAMNAREAGDDLLAAKASLNAARLVSRRDEFSPALIESALADLDRLPDGTEKAGQQVAAGDLLARAGRLRREPLLALRARAVLESATGTAVRTGDSRALSNAWGLLAELDLDAGDLAQARRRNEQALFEAQRSDSGEAQFQWQWQRARLLERDGREQAAFESYRRALDSLEAVKSDMAAELWARRESMRERVGPAFLAYASLLTRRAAAMGAPAAQELLREAQTVLERFKTVELEDYFRDDCVANYQARGRAVEQTAPRTAVIYPIALEDRLELLITIGPEIRQVVVPVTSAALSAEARQLRRLLEKRATYQYLPHARRLYDWIVRPIEPLLHKASVDTLILIPDGPLRSFPLAALHDGQQFVAARFAVAIAPSLTLVDPKPLSQANRSILAGGLTEPVQGFAPLPYVAQELDRLTALGAREALRDRAFSTANLERELGNRSYSIVHLASHAQFESDSRRSFVLTYDGKYTLDKLEEQMKANRFREEPVEMLFLSACQTAAGDERAALGLAGVAVKAGARSALATLWHINDQAASLMVAEFYRQIAIPGTSKAQALQRAQLALMGDLRYRHPGYWSPFMVIGNWL